MEKNDIFINPTSDIMIKFLIGAKGTEGALKSFINAVLEDSGARQVKSVEIRDPFNHKQFLTDKASILDISAEDTAGERFNIEVQSVGNDVFRNRSLYYWSRLYSGQLKSGEYYETLKPVTCINLLEFELFNESGAIHSCFQLREKDEDFILTSHLNLHFIELPKFYKLSATGKLDEWLIYFKCEGREEEEKKKLMSDIIKNNEYIRETHQRYDTFTSDEENRRIYEARMKLLRDYNTGFHQGMEKGVEEGALTDKQNVLIRQLDKKFGLPAGDKKLILSTTNPDQLDAALDEIITAESLNQVLVKLK